TESVGIEDVAIVDLSYEDAGKAGSGTSLGSVKVKEGNYTGLRFAIGIGPNMNTTKPSDYKSSEPLSNSGYYWAAWNSYIFTKTEGNLDPDGSGAFDLNFSVHTGADTLYRILEVEFPLQAQKEELYEIKVVIDYQKLLDG